MTPTITVLTSLELNASTAVAAPPQNRIPPVQAELCLWLAALHVFLNAANSSDANYGRALLKRNWRSEVRLVNWCLLKCSELNGSLHALQTLPAKASGALQNTLHKAFAFCESLSNLEKADAAMWNACSLNLLNAFGKCVAVQQLLEEYQVTRSAELPPALEWLQQHPELSGILGADVSDVLKQLFGMLARLQLIEQMLKCDRPLKPSLLLFALLKQEALELIKSIENILTLLSSESVLYEILDGFVYITPMELRKVYEHELAGISESSQAPAIFASVENACGLLKDCFQQAVVAIAQVYAPNLAATEIFVNQRTKVVQSLTLRNELWTLLKFVQKVEKSVDPPLLQKLNLQLANFRQTTMLFLMFKDFETTERFIEEIARMRRTAEITQVLHRFGAYLETLLAQVNMRNVLASTPFDYPEIDL